MPFTRENKYLSWYYFLSTAVLMSLAFYGTYWFSSIPGKILSGLLAGLLTSRMFVIYHDFHHKAILRKSRIAKILMTVFGLLTLAPASIWNETHQHHHTHNSKFSRMVIGSFPTISTAAYRESTKAQKFWYLLLRHPLMILFAYIPIFLVSFCLWPFFENPKKYYDCGLAALIHGAIAWALYQLGGWTTVTYSLLFPSLIMFAVGGYIFYAQHNFPSVVLRENDEWDYLDAALNSSSFIKMNKIMRWFTANIGFHHIHHVNSRIPFYRLNEVMNNLVELQNPRSTSLSPSEIWKCIQLKLWDEQQGKMVTLEEFKQSRKNGKPVMEQSSMPSLSRNITKGIY